jgi:transcriptional regulator with XRE-family HTH domain
MRTTAAHPNKIHQGRNVKRFREMLGIKQEALAIQLGEDWHQKRISLLEAKEEIEPELLAIVARSLNIPEEAFRDFDEKKAVLNIQNNYDWSNQEPSINHDCTFSLLDKWLEALEENKKLYERLLVSEREKVEILLQTSKLIK